MLTIAKLIRLWVFVHSVHTAKNCPVIHTESILHGSSEKVTRSHGGSTTIVHSRLQYFDHAVDQ